MTSIVNKSISKVGPTSGTTRPHVVLAVLGHAAGSVTLGAVCLVAVFCLGAFLTRVSQVQKASDWLAQIGAIVRWDHETFNPKTGEMPKLHASVARVVGPALCSNIAAVEIAHGDLADDDLKRLSYLTSVTTLRLRSNEASDASLEIVSNLPQLSRLVLAGRQFTLNGLLQLRKIASLKSLVLCEMELNDSELAVLESSIPNVDLVYYGQSSLPVYRRLSRSRVAAATALTRLLSTTEPSADSLFDSNASASDPVPRLVEVTAEIQS